MSTLSLCRARCVFLLGILTITLQAAAGAVWGDAILQQEPQEDTKYENDEEVARPVKISKQATIMDPITNTVIETGIGCGFHTLTPGRTLQITSSNYGLTRYNNNDACVWKFTGDNCLLAAKCPCFDVPASFQCFGDYLKISDSILYSQKFCGDVAPQGAYRSVSGNLRIRFRTDYAGYAGRGFLCYVFCTEPGFADPTLSLVQAGNNNAMCFPGTMPTGPTSPTLPTTTDTGEVGIPPAVSFPSTTTTTTAPTPVTTICSSTLVIGEICIPN